MLSHAFDGAQPARAALASRLSGARIDNEPAREHVDGGRAACYIRANAVERLPFSRTVRFSVVATDCIRIPMSPRSGQHILKALVLALLLFVCAAGAAAQDELDELSDDAADPIKLFDKGQKAHAKKEYEQALEFYEEALKLRPEFPEAEYQKASVLVALNRMPEAEKSFRRASVLQPNWPLPHATLGLLLVRVEGRVGDAETLLRRAVELDAKDELGSKKLTVVATLADLRARAGDTREALALWQRATALDESDASLWVARGSVERAAKDDAAALKSFSRALDIEPGHTEARLRRAELLFEAGQTDRALEDARAAEAAAARDAKLGALLSNLYVRMKRTEDARRVLDALPAEAQATGDAERVRAALDARCEDTPEARAAVEKLVGLEPRNASALACLGSLLRTSEPQRSLEYYRRASEVDPRNADYATGFAAALIQLRQLAEAATVLERVLRVAPDHYAAHTNFATALYGLKLYKRAIEEYKWISRARPELAVVYFLLGSSHDHVGEFPEALAAYETFLARADGQTNQLEIDKVKLRLPSLRRQIARGEGAKTERKNR